MQAKVQGLIAAGVIVEDPASVFIDEEVSVGSGSVIGPNVQLRGASKIGRAVHIEGTAFLKDTIVKDGALVRFSVRCEGAVIGEKAQVGPFAHLRPGAVLGPDSHVGNFVELKKAELGMGSKANHLAYLGDCAIGKNTNIGAGTIVCNYDGYFKYHTTIGDGVFVGSNSLLISPINVGDGAFVAAGSVVQRDVPQDELVLTRPQLKTKPGWAKAYRERKQREKGEHVKIEPGK